MARPHHVPPIHWKNRDFCSRRSVVPGEKDRAFLPDEAKVVLIYCSAYDRWLIVEEHLTAEGLVLQTPESSQEANPYVKISHDTKLEKFEIRRFLVQFGMSPASRTRVHATPPEQPADPMDKYRRRRTP